MQSEALKLSKQSPTESIPTATITPSVFDALPESALVRKAQLVQSPKRPDVPAPLPFGEQTLWRKVKAGTFPAPIRLSPRMSCWRVADVRAWLASQGAV